MTKLRLIFIFVICLLGNNRSLIASIAPNQLFHLEPAWNLLPGTLQLHGFFRTFQTNEIIRTANSPQHAVPFRNFHNGLAVRYGLTQNFEVGLSQILYQDHHQESDGYNLPDDLMLSIKYATARFSDSYFHFSGDLSTRLPLAKKHNVVLEPFSSSKPAFKVLGMVSFAPDHYIPENIFSLHLNLGYQIHANSGEIITNSRDESLATTGRTQELLYGFAMFLPLHSLKFSLEFSGNKFISKPPVTANSRMNYLYFTPALHLPLYKNFRISLGTDFRMSAGYPLEYDEYRPEENQVVTFHLPSYPKWRIQAAVHFNFSLRKPVAQPEVSSDLVPADSVQSDSVDAVIRQQEKLKNLAPETYRELKRIESSRENLKQIKEDRLKRDLELEELRKKMEKRNSEPEQQRGKKERDSSKETDPNGKEM